MTPVGYRLLFTPGDWPALPGSVRARTRASLGGVRLGLGLGVHVSGSLHGRNTCCQPAPRTAPPHCFPIHDASSPQAGRSSRTLPPITGSSKDPTCGRRKTRKGADPEALVTPWGEPSLWGESQVPPATPASLEAAPAIPVDRASACRSLPCTATLASASASCPAPTGPPASRLQRWPKG